jgi:hypothetical protein
MFMIIIKSNEKRNRKIMPYFLLIATLFMQKTLLKLNRINFFK